MNLLTVCTHLISLIALPAVLINDAVSLVFKCPVFSGVIKVHTSHDGRSCYMHPYTFVHKVYYQVIRTVAHVNAFMELLSFTLFMVAASTVHSVELYFSVAKISPYIASFEKPIARLFIFAKHLNMSGPYKMPEMQFKHTIGETLHNNDDVNRLQAFSLLLQSPSYTDIASDIVLVDSNVCYIRLTLSSYFFFYEGSLPAELMWCKDNLHTWICIVPVKLYWTFKRIFFFRQHSEHCYSMNRAKL